MISSSRDPLSKRPGTCGPGGGLGGGGLGRWAVAVGWLGGGGLGGGGSGSGGARGCLEWRDAHRRLAARAAAYPTGVAARYLHRLAARGALEFMARRFPISKATPANAKKEAEP